MKNTFENKTFRLTILKKDKKQPLEENIESLRIIFTDKLNPVLFVHALFTSIMKIKYPKIKGCASGSETIIATNILNSPVIDQGAKRYRNDHLVINERRRRIDGSLKINTIMLNDSNQLVRIDLMINLKIKGVNIGKIRYEVYDQRIKLK